ncbi:MAG: hypothetical protein IPN31_00370 [Bacteroidetes bacterium]|nr:hypothetical protein [Bacteroidota bacterium]
MIVKFRIGFVFVLIMHLSLMSERLFAQSFHIFPVEHTLTYQKSDSTIYFSKIINQLDVPEGSIYFFNSLIDTNNAGILECLFYTQDTSILGTKYLVNENGYDILFNRNGDSIFFKPGATLNEEWKFYTFENGDYVTAKYTTPLYLTIVGTVFDSLKRCELSVFDMNDLPITSHWLDTAYVDMTKNYGLSRFYNINEFPVDTSSFKLFGRNNPDTSVTDVTVYDAFNFQLGNEFHYITEKLIGDIESIYSLKKEKFFVLDKTQYADSVKYVMYHAAWEATSSGFEAPDTIRTIDTVTITYRYADYAFLDSLEMTLLQANNFGYSDFFKSDTIYWGRAYKEVFDWFDYDASENCLSNSDNIYLPEQRYGDGIGIMHYKDSTDVANYIIKDQVWFQKGLEVWGDPIDFEELGVVDVKDIIAYGQIQLYPNPANDNILFYFT